MGSDYSAPVTSASSAAPLRVLVYSDDRTVRSDVLLALGKRPVPGLPEVTYLEVATEPALVAAADAGGIDLFILDGEAVPAGGMGMSRQLKDEIYLCPPILVLIARQQDAWLATWSRADAVAAHPINAIDLAIRVGEQLQRRVAARAS